MKNVKTWLYHIDLHAHLYEKNVIMRYLYECGSCVTRKATPEELLQYQKKTIRIS